MKIFFQILVTSIILINTEISAYSDKYLFCYKFRPGEFLTYHTNRQDSVLLGSQSPIPAKDIRIHLRETLVVKESDTGVDHTMSYHLDSMDISSQWTSPSLTGWDMLANPPVQISDTMIQISTNGYPLSDDTHYRFNQLILPLSEYPLETNGGWDFKFNIKSNDASYNNCESIVFGHGMLYDFIYEDTRVLARFVINTTQIYDEACYNNDASDFQFKRKGEIKSTHLVYFDENLGIITKIVTDQTTREKRTSRTGQVALTIKSKATTELVDWDMLVHR